MNKSKPVLHGVQLMYIVQIYPKSGHFILLDSYDKIFFSWKIRGPSMMTEGFGILTEGFISNQKAALKLHVGTQDT